MRATYGWRNNPRDERRGEFRVADDLASLMNQGLELAQNGDIAAARILFRRAVAGPGAAHPLVHYNLAKALA